MLDRHPFLRTADFEECRATYSAAGLGLSPQRHPTRDGGFGASINRLSAPRFDMYYYDFSVGVELTAWSEDPDYWMTYSMPSDGRGNQLPVFRKLSSPSREDPVDIHEGNGMLGLRLTGAEMTRFAERFFGEALAGPIIFDTKGDMRTPADQAVAHQLSGALALDRQDPETTLDPEWQNRLFEAVAATLLTFRPHSASRLAARPNPGPAPRDVRRVLDYMECHLDRKITLSELSLVAGVPVRTLSGHFARFVGLSPMAYLKHRRMMAVHRALAQGHFGSVTDAALACGLTALGRFAVEYKAAFGESPSETLRRR